MVRCLTHAQKADARAKYGGDARCVPVCRAGFLVLRHSPKLGSWVCVVPSDAGINRRRALRTGHGVCWRSRRWCWNLSKVILVCDHLHTHTRGAFYEAFEPERARAMVRRLSFCYMPKHGSWLNIAENELSAMTRPCVTGRRFATIELLRLETLAWHCASNAKPRGGDWQFKIDDTRIKLKSIYPKIIA